MDPNGFFCLNSRIYVLSTSNLYTYILQYNHDHILAGYFSQNKILELIYHKYSWSSLHTDVQQFYKSYITCMWSKL